MFLKFTHIAYSIGSENINCGKFHSTIEFLTKKMERSHLLYYMFSKLYSLNCRKVIWFVYLWYWKCHNKHPFLISSKLAESFRYFLHYKNVRRLISRHMFAKLLSLWLAIEKMLQCWMAWYKILFLKQGAKKNVLL